MARGDSRGGRFRYHLELTPAQLKVAHAALRERRERLGEGEEGALLDEVLGKLPDEHTLRSIPIEREPADEPAAGEPAPVLELAEEEDPPEDEPPPTVA
jgi:hypothetical protein